MRDAGTEARWFAIYTTPRHEKSVARHMGQREIEHYLPLYRSERRWSDGSKVTLDLPLFPGYIFVRITNRERGQVLGVPGVLSMVSGTGGVPAVLPDALIDVLRGGLAACQAEPHRLLMAGQRARIRTGALAGMEGVVIRMKGTLRVVLTIEQLMRSIAVEVASEDLEPLQSESSKSSEPWKVAV
ncbi:MAG: UpxY family transcription antiterminator [Terracidiphilus sp.]|nr:UpxY family transcription antiterminator [Terracidiphilus sp.]